MSDVEKNAGVRALFNADLHKKTPDWAPRQDWQVVPTEIIHIRRQGDEYPELTFEDWVECIEGENGAAIEILLDDQDHRSRLGTAPGSRDAHHAWQGGYVEHVRQTMFFAAQNFLFMQQSGVLSSLPDEEQFDLSDALTVMFLHDIEKPFMYRIDNDGLIETTTDMSKDERKTFRQSIIDTYGFVITPTMYNALQFVEGVRDSAYIPGKRADEPLAALCHAADNLSARAYYTYRGKNESK
ncbi:MAG: hypothetical protein ABIQ04_03745 [Candidatus Saccharimonadales bacterium]